MVPKYQSEEEARSVVLRFFIHYLGDIHQPLHGITIVNPSYPNGDFLATRFPLPEKLEVKSLH